MSPEPVSPIDARLRVLSTVLEPGIKMARVLGLTLDDLHQLVAVGYYRELKERGASWQQIARRIDKSRRTVATLARVASGATQPLAASHRIGLRRRTVRILADGDLDLADLAQQLPAVSGADLEEAVDQLVAEGILTRDGERLTVAGALLDLVGDDLDHRIDSLRHFLDAVGQVIYRRFLAPDSNGEAFARVLTFSTSRERLATLRAETYGAVAKAAQDADAEASGDPGAIQASIALSFVETPRDRRYGPRRG